MAFGKKKAVEPQAAVPAPLPNSPDGAEGGLTPELFGADAAAPEAVPSEDALLAPEAPAVEEAPAEAAADAPAIGGGDDFLRMFQESQIESSDNSAMLELAGEVAIEDLLEDLLTVASAMGIKRPVPA